MKWRVPSSVTFGHGRTRRVVAVRVLKLSEFQAEYMRHAGGERRGPIPKALCCYECKAIFLREDRRSDPGFPHDFSHELDHAYVDWRGSFYEP